MPFAATSEPHQKGTAIAEPAQEPSGSAQHAAAEVTAPLGGPIGPQPAPSASGLGDDDTTCAPGPQLPRADSNGLQPANGIACPVLFQPIVLVAEFSYSETLFTRCWAVILPVAFLQPSFGKLQKPAGTAAS